MNKGSLYIGKIFGIKMFIHWSFLFLIAWIVVENFRQGKGNGEMIYTLAFVCLVFVCVTLHELGHALTAKQFKYYTRDITLLPIGGMARMDEIPENPKHELIVAVAGPLVNLFIALLLYPFVYWFGKIPTLFSVLYNTGDTFLFSLLVVNLGLAVFNLIPAFPMDGGRIFRAALSFFVSRLTATTIAVRIGQFIATGFFFIGIFYNPFLSLIGILIFFMAQIESDYVRSKSILHDYTVKDVIIKKFYSLDATDTVEDAVKGLLDVQATDFLVIENGNVVGTLNRDRIIHALAEKGKEAPVALAMNTSVKILTPDMPLDRIFLEFKQNENSVLPVKENKKLIGIVDFNNILELIMVKTAVEKSPAYSLKEKTRLEEVIS